MHVLQIEHPIRDFDTWKGAFDYVIIELEFDSPGEAEAFLGWLRRDVWASREAAPALMGDPRTRIVEAVEVKEY